MRQISFEDAQELFMRRCKLRNLSPCSIVWYRYRIESLAKWMRLNHPDDTPGTTTIHHLRDWIAYEMDRGLSVTTVNHSVVAIRTLFAWLCDEGYIDKNPAAKLDRAKGQQRLILPLSEDQIASLLAQPNKRKFAGIRDYTAMLLMLDTGLRLRELLNIEVDNIDWRSRSIRVMGKGAKERIVIFGAICAHAIREYVGRRGDSESPYLFVSELGDQLAARSLQDAMRRYGRSAAITGVRVSPHTLRHSFAVTWIRNHGDPFHLQRLLGHTSLEIVRRYVNLATTDLQAAHAKFSPIDHMSGTAIERPKERRRRIK